MGVWTTSNLSGKNQGFKPGIHERDFEAGKYIFVISSSFL
jgi:hypothetical protein